LRGLFSNALFAALQPKGQRFFVFSDAYDGVLKLRLGIPKAGAFYNVFMENASFLNYNCH
jgi:hypothetical protein